MDKKNIHNYTMRVNTNSYVGQKVVSTLKQLKQTRHMSYNMLLQESVLMLGDDMEPENFVPDVEKNDVNLDTSLSPKEDTAEEISDEALYALLDNAFTERY